MKLTYFLNNAEWNDVNGAVMVVRWLQYAAAIC